MKIACVILGTRGDVQPIVALAKGLTDRGHEVTICAHMRIKTVTKTRCYFFRKVRCFIQL